MPHQRLSTQAAPPREARWAGRVGPEQGAPPASVREVQSPGLLLPTCAINVVNNDAARWSENPGGAKTESRGSKMASVVHDFFTSITSRSLKSMGDCCVINRCSKICRCLLIVVFTWMDCDGRERGPTFSQSKQQLAKLYPAYGYSLAKIR